MKAGKILFNLIPIQIAMALVLSCYCRLQAADQETPSQTKAVSGPKLTPQELAQRQLAAKQFAEFEARAKAAAASRRAEIAARLTKMVPAHLVSQYDSNGNGLIDPDEWRKYRQDVDQQIAALRQAREAAANSTASPAANK
jgi:hypothetical protein